MNDALCALLGRDRAELVGHLTMEFASPAEATRAGPTIPKDHFGEVEVDKQLVRADGSRVWVRVSGVWAADDDCVIEHLTDLTDLIVARERLDALVMFSSNLILVIGADGRLAHANPATQRLFGDRIGEDCLTVLSGLIHPDDLEHFLEVFTEAMIVPGQHAPLRFRIRDLNGDWVHLEAIGNNQLDNPSVHGLVVNARDVTERETQRTQIEDNLKDLITTLGRASEYRDPYTAGHQHQVAELATGIANAMNLDAHQVESIRLGAEVHDIGKIAIPAELLSHPGTLTPLVYDLIKTHCQVGHDIVADINFPWPIAAIILQHHERLDGTGYPNALHGDQILLEAQVVAVADVTDAITSHRPYRPALDTDIAITELQQGSGTKYNPAAVNACIDILLDKLLDPVADPTDPLSTGSRASAFQ